MDDIEKQKFLKDDVKRLLMKLVCRKEIKEVFIKYTKIDGIKNPLLGVMTIDQFRVFLKTEQGKEWGEDRT